MQKFVFAYSFVSSLTDNNHPPNSLDVLDPNIIIGRIPVKIFSRIVRYLFLKEVGNPYRVEVYEYLPSHSLLIDEKGLGI